MKEKNKIQCLTEYNEVINFNNQMLSIQNNCNTVIGPTGQEGIAGQVGKSAYDIAVDNGFVGSELDWLNSLKGPKGKSAKCTNLIPFSSYSINMHIDNQTMPYVNIQSCVFSSRNECFNKIDGTTELPETINKKPTDVGCNLLGFSMPSDGYLKAITAEISGNGNIAGGVVDPIVVIYISEPNSDTFKIVPETYMTLSPSFSPLNNPFISTNSIDVNYFLPIGTKVSVVVSSKIVDEDIQTSSIMDFTIKGNLIIETN